MTKNTPFQSSQSTGQSTGARRAPAWAAAIFCSLLGLAAAQAVRGDDAAAKWKKLQPQNNALFEKAHTILEANCFSCHGPTKQVAGLRLDTRAGLLKGAASGPVIVGSDPAKSSLAQVLHYKGDVQMPPKGKLPAADIAAIEAWIKGGAPWPGAEAAPPATKPAAAKPATAKPATAKPAAAKLDPQVVEFFETKVRPVLANNCFSCHGPDKQMAALRLDSQSGVLKGSDSGPIIVDKDPAKSLLIQVVRHSGKIKMPLGSAKLKDAEIAALEEWVKLGAPWPGAAPSDVVASVVASHGSDYVITDEQRRFWSFQPVKNHVPPPVKTAGWASSPLDNFILAKLEARKLSPNKRADRRTLIRRATYDLHGLLPTPGEVDAFVKDTAPDAWEKLIDRLLASPHYGERWGRHWLDVARYADTKGYVFVEDRNYPHAYNYRDWVIRAFNEDLPYDQFITQQLAADRLPLGDDKRPLAAMGFLRVGRRFLNQQPDIIDDRIDTTMRGFQGLSTACARCHDHKFDPIPTKDYYSLYGVFASSIEPPDQPISPKEISDPWAAHDQKVRDAEAEQNQLIRDQVKLLRERDKTETLPDEVKKTLAKFREREKPDDKELPVLEPAFEAAARDKIKALKESLETLRKSYPPAPELAMTMADAPEPVTQHVFKRGNQGNRGDEVPRRFHLILSKGERPLWTKGSGRLELAQSIASKDNPLTARVMVNRIWLQHFGAGLVRTPSDFGARGERPTHPELLDYLARRFMDGGWSIKKMHRLIMLSSAYQQSSESNPKNFLADPENTLLWRMNRRRLELEALRDSLLLAAGRLDTKVGGPSVDLWQAPYPTRRTVYGQIERQNLPGIFRTFDFAGPDSSSPQRFRTTVPQQALFLMNSEFAIEQARRVAERPELAARKDEASRLRALYYVLFGRTPDAAELALGMDYLKSAAAPSKPPQRPGDAWHYGYGTYNDAAKRVTSFTPLPFFKDNTYRGGPKAPDPDLHWTTLSPEGGHPGHDAAHSAIRRWIAPQDGILSIKGSAAHGNPDGDGVEMHLVSSRDGSLGAWTLHNSQAQTGVEKVKVRQGDTLDFVVSCRANDGYDSFTWSNVITLEGGATWNSSTQFNGPAPSIQSLSGWARYAQALLMTNEFFFVD